MKNNKELNDKALETVNGGNDQERREYEIQWHLVGECAQDRQDKGFSNFDAKLNNWQDNEG